MCGYLPRFVAITFLTLLLTACGGGGGGGIGGGDDDAAATPVLTISILDSGGVPTNDVMGNTPVTIRAVLEDGTGSSIGGQVISFSSEVGQLNPVSGTVLTGTDGVAEISLGAGTEAKAGTASASTTIDGVTILSNSVGIQSDGLEVDVSSSTLTVSFSLSTPDNSITVTRDNIGTGTITVTDANGDPVSQAIVQFSTSAGVLEPASGAVTTNSSGIATITLLAGTTAGSGLLSATVSNEVETVEAADQSFITDGTAFASIELSILSQVVARSPNPAPTSAVVGGAVVISNASPETIVATVIDAKGLPVQGVIVTFNNSGQGVLSAATDITNASGQATTNLLPGTVAGFGEITATTTVDGLVLSTPSDGSITFSTDGDGPFDGVGTSNLEIAIALVDSSGDAFTGSIDADNPAILEATVKDATGTVLPDIVIEFSTDGIGDLFPINGLTLTNSLGVATAALNAGSTPGAGLATATLLLDGARFNSDSLTFSTLGNAGDTVIVVNLTFTDATPGNESNIITKLDDATVGVLVEDDGGTNLPNRSATITTSLGTVSISGGTPAQTTTAITDADGRIEVLLEAGNTFGTGDFVVTVGDTSETIQFDVGVAGLQIGTCSGGVDAFDCGAGTTFSEATIDIGETPLSAGGTSSIGLVVVDSDLTPVPNIDIAFFSNCSNTVDPDTELPLASISSNLTSNSAGAVAGTYQATGCVDNDIITATESSTGKTATGTILVRPPTIGSIIFDSVTDSQGTSIDNIFIQESGGESTARVIFEVQDVFGLPAEDEDVDFELTTNVGGIALQNTTALTDSDGKAIAFVNAGFISTAVRVRASIDIDTDDDGIDDTTLVTLSGQLSVNTGIADQNSFSIAVSEFNFEGMAFDGETITLSAFLADGFNNPVPDGTSVSFRTELGRIEPSCNTTDGNCNVTLNSQEPRGPLDPNTIEQVLGVAQCPSTLVLEEQVSEVGTDVFDTEYQVATVYRVESTANAALTLNTHYTVDSDGSGITCVNGQASCTGPTTLKITYDRAALDEVDDNTSNHSSTTPGKATGPFRSSVQGVVPCRAASSAQGGAIFSGYNGGLGQLYGGRSTVLATALGEESFIDSNGNGKYDFNEPFVDLPEAFHDFNEDGVFGNGTVGVDDSRDTTNRECYGPTSPITVPGEVLGNCYQVGGDEETFVDFGDATTLNNQFDAGNGIYNGTLCEKEISDRTDTCDNLTDPCDEATEQYCTRELVNIRRESIIVFSGSGATFSLRDASTGEYINDVDISATGPGTGNFTSTSAVTENDGTAVTAGTAFSVSHSDNDVAPQVGDTNTLSSGTGSVIVDYADSRNAKLPAGTTISVASGTDGCLIQNSPGTTQLSTFSTGVSSIGISLINDSSKPGGGGAPVTVTVTTPNSVTSTFSFSCVF